MPNFRAKKVCLDNLPVTYDEVEFKWASVEQNGCSLVLARLHEQNCLIQISKKADYYVCKIDKLAKLSNLATMQRMLLAFMHACAQDIIDAACAYNEAKELKSNIIKSCAELNELIKNKDAYVEIGFGSGRHLLAQAKANEASVYIGIEIHKPSLLQVSKLASAQNLNNVFLMDLDARAVLATLSAQSLKGIYVHFPVPWPQAPSRRVISADFANLCDFCLQIGGFMHLRTDEEFYYQYSKEIFKDFKIQSFINQKGLTISKYEARWQKQGKDIYDLFAYKISHDLKPTKCLNDQISSFKTKQLRLCFNKTDKHFAKVARIYKCPCGFLALVHFGAFDVPTSAYLLFKDDLPCEFINGPIIPSSANIQAWQLLKDTLCQQL